MDDNSTRDVRLQLVDPTRGAVFLVSRRKLPLLITKVLAPAGRNLKRVASLHSHLIYREPFLT